MKKIKKPFGNPLYGMAAVIVLIVLLGLGALLLLTGDDDKDTTATMTTTEQKKAEKQRNAKAARRPKPKPAPVVNGAGTLDVARSEGRLAVAQARGRIKNPTAVSVRVSAAPKQTVTVDYQLACYRPAGTRVAKGRFRILPPATKALSLPFSGATECTVTVNAQLTTGGSNGRVKVAVIAG